MSRFQYIKTLTFGQADYYLENGPGQRLVLKIDYKKNQYHLVKLGEDLGEKFLQEVRQLAADLLTSKHNKNFAEQK